MIAHILTAPPADAPAASATSRSAVMDPESVGFAGLLDPKGATPAGAEPAEEGTEISGLLASSEPETPRDEPSEAAGELSAPPLDGILDPALRTASRPLGELAGADAPSDLPSAQPQASGRTEPVGTDPGFAAAASATGQLAGGARPVDAGPAQDAPVHAPGGRRISRGDILSAAFSVMERATPRQGEPAQMEAAADAAGPKELPEAAPSQAADLLAVEASGPSRPLSTSAPAAAEIPPAYPASDGTASHGEDLPGEEAQASGPSGSPRQVDDVALRSAPAARTAAAAQGDTPQVPAADAPALTGEAFSAEPAADPAEMQAGHEPASVRPEAQPASQLPAQALTAARFRSPLARSVATQLSGASLDEGSVTIRLRPQGMGVIEIEIARGAQGHMEIAMRVQNPMVLDALRAERSALSDLLAGSGARPESLDLGLFQPGGEGRDGGQENRENGAAPSVPALSRTAAGEDAPAAPPALPVPVVHGSSLTDIIA